MTDTNAATNTMSAEDADEAAPTTITDGMPPTRCTVVASFHAAIPVDSEVWLFSLGDGVFEVMDRNNQPFGDTGDGPSGGVLIGDVELVRRALVPCAGARHHYFLPNPAAGTTNWVFSRVPTGGDAEAPAGRWVTPEGVFYSTGSGVSTFSRRRALDELSAEGAVSHSWVRTTKREALALLSDTARARFLALDREGALPARITDTEIEARLGATVVAILKANPAAEVAAGHIRAKLNVAIPTCATYEECLVQIRRRYRGATGVLPPASGSSGSTVRPAARPRDVALVMNVDYSEEESAAQYITNQRSGSGEYELTLEELREISEDSADEDEFVENIAEALRQKALEEPPDTDVDNTDYGDEYGHTTESSDASVNTTDIRRSLRSLFETYPDLNPEYEAPDEDEED